MKQWEAKGSEGWEAFLTPTSVKNPVIGETPPSFLAATLCPQETLSDKSILEWAVHSFPGQLGPIHMEVLETATTDLLQQSSTLLWLPPHTSKCSTVK